MKKITLVAIFMLYCSTVLLANSFEVLDIEIVENIRELKNKSIDFKNIVFNYIIIIFVIIGICRGVYFEYIERKNLGGRFSIINIISNGGLFFVPALLIYVYLL
ncbi:hypothetical protein CP985_13640 [Malaciobacter mytili LMG 24559]|uniref:DUF4134 domain-containing protein n=1 Tax=Malaciobacter mytili LMG 24559 TaxID=1032238 RepID=A0AAX2AEB5_9BACT|nr:hypothetical protein [Malaciobacter mytili]AXH16444.1 putative membrane protein [Malaciobacter mytili LMG 24559]RXK12993.1 hypothetical protein CP985_13640 [Malaciobacter mytili LMG 24559]